MFLFIKNNCWIFQLSAGSEYNSMIFCNDLILELGNKVPVLYCVFIITMV